MINVFNLPLTIVVVILMIIYALPKPRIELVYDIIDFMIRFVLTIKFFTVLYYYRARKCVFAVKVDKYDLQSPDFFTIFILTPEEATLEAIINPKTKFYYTSKELLKPDVITRELAFLYSFTRPSSLTECSDA